MALYRTFLSPDRQNCACSWFSLPEKWPFQAESEPVGLLTGVYICEEIMTMPMVRRRKKISISLVSAGIRAGRPSMSHRTLKEVLWLKGLISAAQAARQTDAAGLFPGGQGA
jgi:hypothetical protein